MRTDTCLSDAELEEFQLGRLPDEAAARIDEHLEACPRCAQELKRFDRSDDGLLAAIRDSMETVGSASSARGPAEATARLCERPPLPPSHALDDIHGPNLEFLARPQQPDELGRLGSYRVLQVLGVGGMGTVLRAEDPSLKRQLALKVVNPELAADDECRQRFLREAQAAAAVEHPGIVPIYQVGEIDNVPFLTMPLLKGESLDARLKREKRLPISEAVRSARQIAEGLAAAHEHGLIHRDIKPGNIWLDEKQGHAKLLDFGLARHVKDDTELTKPGTVVGTPAYMAPEQAANRPLDHRCDLFSLGALLYRMLTGEPPFAGTDTMSMLLTLATETPVTPRERNPDVPAALDQLVMQLLNKEPADRPASAQIVADALSDLEHRASIQTEPDRDPFASSPSAAPVDRTQRLDSAVVLNAPGRWRRRTVLVRLAASLLAGAVLAGIVIIIRNKDGSETKVTVPDGASVEVRKDGKAIAMVGDKLQEKQLAVVKWLMEEKGLKQIQVEKNGRDVHAKTVPAAPFKLRRLKLAPFAGVKRLGEEELQRLTVLVDLEELDLNGQGPSDNALAKLAPLVKLRQLSIDTAKLTPAAVQTLRRFPKLENLLIVIDSDEWLKDLAKLPELQSLAIQGAKVSGPSMTWFKVYPKLTRLRFSGTDVSEAALLQLKEVKQLHLLEVASADLRRDALKTLAKAMPWCEIHDNRDEKKPVIYNQGKAAALDQLAVVTWLMREKKLKVIEIEKEDRRAPTRTVPSLPFKVRGLNLYPAYASHLTAEELERLHVLVDLEKLAFDGQPLTDETLAHLAPLVNLRELSLNATQVTPAAVEILRRFPNLEQLRSTTFGSEESIRALAELPKLQCLFLTGVEVADPTMRLFKDYPMLTCLRLHDTKTSEAGLLQLKEAKQLRLLDLKSATVPTETVERLAKEMPWCEIRDNRDQNNPVIYNKGKAEGISPD